MPRTIAQFMIVGLLAVVLATGAAAAQKAPSFKLIIPPDEALAIMIKTGLIAFNQANLTGNYSVLRDLAAPSFREANTQARLAEIFQDLRQRKIDLGPIVLLQPKLTRAPWIDDHRLLRLSGFFASRPEQVEFDLAYAAVDGIWRLFLIRVTTKKVVDAAPAASNDAPTADVKTTASNDRPAAVQPLPRPRPVQ